MIWPVLLIILIACIFLPSIWVRMALHKYSEPADRYRDRGSGAELARHLLNSFELDDVGVEESDKGDHYDPRTRTVRLIPDHYGGYSLTAVTVAAHEVGHAIQHARGEALFHTRQRLVTAALYGQRLASLTLMVAPLLLVLTRMPHLSAALLLVGVASMALGTVVHLVTLPVELDASYGKALPILKAGDYLHDGDLQHAEKVLKAAALTYVASSLASLLNLSRWIAVLRR